MGLLDGLDNVTQALAAQQFALSITQRNIANANNPAYTRQEAVFTTGDESSSVNSGIPGVYILASRNQYLDSGISHELQSMGEQEVMSEALKQIETFFSLDGSNGLQQAVSDFFGSFNDLASAPEDMVARRQVLTSANAMATEFHRIYSSLQQLQISEERYFEPLVQEINSLTANIASLNEKIPAARASENGSVLTLIDERQQCLEKLSELMGISYFETESGSITVTDKKGAALVLENRSYNLETGAMASGSYSAIYLNGVDITSDLEGGRLGGLIRMRDSQIVDSLNVLDEMAAAIITRVNQQHAMGSDLEGNAGEDFFLPFTQPSPESNTGAAGLIQVSITDPQRIAAAAAGAGPGNNENARSILAIEDEPLLTSSSQSLLEFYASFIFMIGTASKSAVDNIAMHTGILNQLKNQRDADHGVNMDEEAVNIIKYQKAYEACARYANTTIALSDEILRLLGG